MSKMMRAELRYSVVPALGVILATFATPALADDPQSGLKEIIVTAQRRAENVQKVPISVATVTASTIESLGVVNTESIGQLLPGLQLVRQGQGVVTYVRGVGSSSASGSNEPSVAMYIDDVYVPSGSGAVFDFNNIDSVSVVKGPQGTLFGRNATGGVIQVKTRDPSQKPELDIDAGYANYDKITTAVYASGGITENIAANIAGYYNDQHDGWGRNVITGKDQLANLAYGVRAKIKGTFGDTTVLLTGVYDKRKFDQQSRIPDGTFGYNGWSPQALGLGFYDVASNIPVKFNNDSYTFSGKLEHDFGNAKFRSITSYGNVGYTLLADVEASPTDAVDAKLNQSGNTFTQELQLLSSSSAPVQWIMGLFYLHASVSNHTLAFGGGGVPNDAYSRQRTNSYSGFGQMTAEILPKLKATLGLRYTDDERHFDAHVVRLGLVSSPMDDSAGFKNLTGRFSLDYQLFPDVMVYAAYNKGFKSGFYNIGGVFYGISVVPGPIKPESLDAYTVGFKSEFFNRRARFNVEYFYYDYSNIQVTQLVGTNNIVSNGGKATIQGVDAELTVIPVRNLTLNLAMSYADGTYDSFLNGPTFFPLAPNARIPIPASCGAIAYPGPAGGTAGANRSCNLSGNNTIQTAPFTSTFTASYTIPSEIGEFNLLGSYYHGGKQYFTPDNNPRTRQPALNLINASLSWASPSKRYGLTLWGNNLTGKKYYSNITESTLGGFLYTTGSPRTYGLTAKVKFGG